MTPSLLIAREQPRGHQVTELRERAGFTGPTLRAAREACAERIFCTEQQLKNWEIERRGGLMPEDTWLLMRITFDPLARAQWERWIHRRAK